MKEKKYKKAMELLSKNKKSIFLGQTCSYPGSYIFNSLSEIPKKKKIEMPVFEDTQMGMSIGLALEGFIPIAIYPRMDFLICASNQLINHLDKLSDMSKEFKVGIIIRTKVGSKRTMDVGVQHSSDYYAGLKRLLKHINIFRIKRENEIISTYKSALKLAKQGRSSIIIDY